MAVTAQLVKELREKTGAGMLDCKKALEETAGDLAKAVDWLREQGIAKSTKKAGRIAAEGLSKAISVGNRACIVEVNSETDFVAKNEQFIELIDTTLNTIINSNVSTLEEALALTVDGETLEDKFISATATIGEKIVLRRFEVIEKTDSDVFGLYIHMGGKISVVTVCKDSDNAQVAKDMAMQVASMNPPYISREYMSEEFINHEKEIQLEILRNDETQANKPANVLEKIVEGRLSKALQDLSLVDQIYFKEPSMKCGEYLKQNNTSVIKFVRYEVGEGIEKREENFAEEVAKQIQK